VEDTLAVVCFVLLAVLPGVEIVLRSLFRLGVQGYSNYVVHLVLVLAFVGGMITSREKQHLAMSAGLALSRGDLRAGLQTVVSFISVSICTALAWSSAAMLLIGFDPRTIVGFVPIQVFVAAMPVGFAVMAVRFFTRAPAGHGRRAGLVLAFVAGTFFSLSSLYNLFFSFELTPPAILDSAMNAWYAYSWYATVPLAVALILSSAIGVPIFVVLAGVAMMFFSRSGGSLEVIPLEGYTMLTASSIPAIPLFTLAGFILSESKAGDRMVGLFRAFFGWMPGGMAVAAVLVSTFFTTFTGASGVTILALGGLLFLVLTDNGHYGERFSMGLLTGSGSIGLLFPPSLAIILYGTVAQYNIFHLFLGGILPGALFVIAMALAGVYVSERRGIKAVAFSLPEALSALKASAWEVLLPVVIVLFYFGGLTTLVETSAIAVLYAFLVETVIHKEIPLRRLPRVILKSVPIVGGVLVILAAARGLSSFIVDVQIPTMLSTWVEAHIDSRFVFLVLLNVALLATGCIMDLYSAILVVAPLVIPLGNLFGVAPVHLGIIFLANLGLGFITPPVGLNLFLASYRFDQPLLRVYRSVWPFFLLQLAIVLIITYVPWFSTALVP
jgi:tripartite ATP-independent transporter DctM subunit